CSACRFNAAAAAAGSSDGALKARWEVACCCSRASSERFACRWRIAVCVMAGAVTREIIIVLRSAPDEAHAVDQHVEGFIDGRHHAGCGLVGGLVGEQAD